MGKKKTGPQKERAKIRKEMGQERIDFIQSDEFLRSFKWHEARFRILKKFKAECMLCRDRTSRLHVDHILPRRTHPELALDLNNLQVLCESCNHGKGFKFTEDFRPPVDLQGNVILKKAVKQASNQGGQDLQTPGKSDTIRP